MQVIADFHTHSRFAMACSSKITINGMDGAAFEKGINLLSTSDFTHSKWMDEVRTNLEPIGDTGLFKVKGSGSGVRFILGGEVSTIFTGNDNKVKKIHNMIALPDLESVASLSDVLKRYGNLESDGRPQLSMSAAQLVEEVFKVNRNALVFPAHAWTPYFGALGSISGFNSIKEAYEDQEKHIHALETGLSSDPMMNWMLSSLDKYTLLSNSDMHSLPKLGREANVFDLDGKDFTYSKIIDVINNRDVKHLKRTIEFYPEEGKYHFDGHRQCKFSIDPTKTDMAVCKVCGKKLTIGVVHRVKDLADRPHGYRPNDAIPYVNLVPLVEVIAYAMHKGVYSPLVESQYRKLLSLGKEFDVLTDVGLESIKESSSSDIAESIGNMRENRITVIPGYDGVFGEIELLNRKVRPQSGESRQRSLFG
ncbi:MAG: endonuclease Q family protein [Candidatus Micrarchaeaceae archaeon]